MSTVGPSSGAVFFLLWLSLMGYLPLEGGGGPSEPRTSSAALVLPDSAPLVLSFTDPATLARHAADTQLWKLASASSAKTELQQALQRAWQQTQADMGFTPEDLRPLFSGPITAAFLEAPVPGSDVPPHFALFVDLPAGGSEKLWMFFATKLFPQAAKWDLLVEPVSSGPVQYTRLLRGSERKVVGAFSIANERFLFVTHETDLATLSAPAAKPLAKQPAYAARAAERGQADVTLDIDFTALFGPALREISPDGPDGWMLQLGVQHLRSLHYSATAVPGGFVERCHLGFAPEGFFWKLLAPAGRPSLRVMEQTSPNSSVVWDVLTGPPMELYREMTRRSPMTPEDLAKARADLGVDLEQDVIAQLSGEFGLAVQLPTISSAVFDNPALALGVLGDTRAWVFLGVTDETQADEVLRKILTKAGMSITDDPYRDVKVAYFTKATADFPIPFFPAFTIQDGILALHLNAGSAKACVDARLDGKGLRGAADFQAASAGLGQDPSAGIFYIKLADVLPLVVRAMQSDFQRRGSDDEFAKRVLPVLAEAEKFSRQLRGMVGRRQIGEGSVLLELSSPLGLFGGAPWLGAVATIEEIPPQ